MNTLPIELLQRILINLAPNDRLHCALTCKHFARAICSPHMLDDISFGFRPKQLYAARRVLINSKRRYTSLKIRKGFMLAFKPEPWFQMCAGVRELIFECDVSAEVLHLVLRQCRELVSLKISGEVWSYRDRTGKKPSRGFLTPPEPISLESMRRTFRNVRHLTLGMRWLNGESLTHLLGLMPNLTSFSVSANFDPNGLNANLKLEKLEFFGGMGGTNVGDRIVTEVADFYPATLRELRINHSLGLSSRAFSAIGDCTKLRHLHIFGLSSSESCHLAKLVRNVPGLLSLTVPHSFSEGDLRLICELKHLQRLHLNYCSTLSRESLFRLGELVTLKHLDLSYTSFDAEVLRRVSLGLKGLRSLSLRKESYRTEELTPECLSIICENFKKLERLELGSIHSLTDEDGIKFCLLEDLEHLRFEKCNGFTDSAFDRGLGSSAMKTLEIGGSSITDVALERIANHHPSLEKVRFLPYSRITDAGLESFLRNLRRVKSLYFEECELLTDRSLGTILDLCPQLRELLTLFCKFSSEARNVFIKRNPRVDFQSYRQE